MSLILGDNFSYGGAKPLDARLKYDTVAQMKAVADSTMYDGCTAYNKESDKTYQWKSTNTVDETLGRWREFSSGGGGTSDYSNLSNKPSIENVTLSGNKSASDLGLAKTTDLADFITKTVDDLVNYYKKTETYTKGEVDTIVTAIKNSRFEVVATLPTSDIKTNVIYLVPSTTSKTKNVKDEYINLDGTSAGWEQIGSTSVDLSNYVTKTELNTALADYTTTTDLTALLAGKQDKMQYSTLPTPSAELEGKIIEYTGATFSWLVHGYFYECVSDGEDIPSYSWQQTNVQPSGGGGSSYTAGDGIDITNDVISTKQSEEGDIDEIIDVYPTAGNLVSIVNAFNKGDIYSTEERMIGQWIDSKPLYQKVFSVVDTGNSSTHTITIPSTLNIESVVYFKAEKVCEGYGISIPYTESNHVITVSKPVTSGDIVFTKDTATVWSGTYYLTMKYTKTTDTAISIGEATEYSTDEKVIGTWIDGKPIYQRSYNLGTAITVSPTTWTATGLNISSVENLIQCLGNNVGLSCPLIGTKAGDNTLKVVTTRAESSSILYITLQYTKTT